MQYNECLTCSRILGLDTEFLKTDGSHGFKDKFLQAFLDVLKSEKIIDNHFNFSCSNVNVYT